MQLAREKPSFRDRLEGYIHDLESAIEEFVIAHQAGGGEMQMLRMMQEIAYSRAIYAQIAERPLLPD
jgi:hypothetical protein